MVHPQSRSPVRPIDEVVLDRTLDDLPLHLWVVCLERLWRGDVPSRLIQEGSTRESFGS